MNKKFKLLALDMDGTTLNSKGEISKGNIEAIRKVSSQGVRVVLISGRPRNSLLKFSKILGIDSVMAAMNGNIIFNSRDGKIIKNHTIDPNHLKRLFSKIDLGDSSLVISVGDDTYVDDKNKFFAKIMQKFVEDEMVETGSDLLGFLEKNGLVEKINKLSLLNEYDKLEAFKNKYMEEFVDEFNQVYPLPFCLEFFNKNYTKATAIKEIADLYEISMDEILAMGDGENDKEMLIQAGYSVSPANCMPSIIKYTDEITVTNDNDAVKCVIEKYLLDKN